MVKNPDGFFDGLPECKQTKRARVPGVTKAMQLEAKKKAIEASHRHIQSQIAKENAKIG